MILPQTKKLRLLHMLLERRSMWHSFVGILLLVSDSHGSSHPDYSVDVFFHYAWV